MIWTIFRSYIYEDIHITSEFLHTCRYRNCSVNTIKNWFKKTYCISYYLNIFSVTSTSSSWDGWEAFSCTVFTTSLSSYQPKSNNLARQMDSQDHTRIIRSRENPALICDIVRHKLAWKPFQISLSSMFHLL